jgi:hypothetical protein
VAGRQLAGRDRVEVLVVPLDPVERRVEWLVTPAVVGDVADAEPVRHVWMPPHDPAHALDVAVDVAEGPENHRGRLMVNGQ